MKKAVEAPVEGYDYQLAISKKIEALKADSLAIESDIKNAEKYLQQKIGSLNACNGAIKALESLYPPTPV